MLPIDDLLIKRVPNRIRYLGVELEGAWTQERALQAGSLLNVVRDSSVSGFDPDKYALIGESPSPRLTLAELPSYMERVYPSAVNATCGMHVHMSFSSVMEYQHLMREEVQEEVIERFKLWATRQGLPEDRESDDEHPIWPRLRGENDYCQHKFFADLQVLNSRKDYDRSRPGHRYTVLNFAYARPSRTIECRLLPMFDTWNLALAAIQHLVAIVNCSLKHFAPIPEEIIIAEYIPSELTIQETIRSCA